MTNNPYSQLEKGSLLIASPDTPKGVYHRSVVLICEYTTAGSFGLVINKPFTVDLPQELQSIQEISNDKVNLRLGGSMQTNQMMLLHTSSQQSDHTLNIIEDIHLGGDLPFLQECILSDTCPNIYLFFGFTGWTTGELEKEFMSDLWYTYPATKSLIFETPPEKLWQTVLKEMGGKYASIAMIPEDPSLN